jgi:hypothetical protein
MYDRRKLLDELTLAWKLRRKEIQKPSSNQELLEQLMSECIIKYFLSSYSVLVNERVAKDRLNP